jgi:hypothetical protein
VEHNVEVDLEKGGENGIGKDVKSTSFEKGWRPGELKRDEEGRSLLRVL